MGTVPTHQQESAASNSGESCTLPQLTFPPLLVFLLNLSFRAAVYVPRRAGMGAGRKTCGDLE